MDRTFARRFDVFRKLITAASLMTLLWPSMVLPAGQPTAVSNLPVAITGRHKHHGKPAAKPSQPAENGAGEGKNTEKK
jgi:hypothetical protein